jgi:hypothetical protein
MVSMEVGIDACRSLMTRLMSVMHSLLECLSLQNFKKLGVGCEFGSGIV